MNVHSCWRAVDRIEDWLAYAAVLVLVLVTASVALSTLLRYAFDTSLIWVIEFSEYGLLYIVFLGTAWILRQDGHVRVDIFVNTMSRKWRERAHAMTSLLGFVVSVLLCYFGAAATWLAYVRGSYNPTVNEVPTWIVLIVIPLGSFFLALRFLKRTHDHWLESKALNPKSAGRAGAAGH